MKPRILIAGLFHETHTFIEERTTLEAFAVRSGDELFAARGDASPLDGFLEVAEEAGWEVVPAVDMRAAPGGMVDQTVVDGFRQSLEKSLRTALEGGLSGIFLVFHGAMVSESCEDVEGEILGRIRSIPGAETLPVFGVYDLHANFTGAMARHSDCLVAYRENPHTDARESTVRAARLLDRCLREGARPRSWYGRCPVIWSPGGVGTAVDPMKALEGRAREFERDDDVWAVNVNAGFSFADTSATGVSFSVSGTCDDAQALKILNALRADAWERRREGLVNEQAAGGVLDRILPVAGGPVVLVEPSDNIGGGAPGDGTGLLRALIERGVAGAALVINDPLSASAAIRAGAGAQLRLQVGGRGSRLDPGPLDLEVDVVSCSDGRFDLEDPQSHLASMRGRRIEMGPCAVVRHEGVTILLTSRRTPPFDLGQLRSQGIDPETLKIIGVKAAVAHRRAYDPIAKAMYWVATPGPCSSRLDTFPYEKLQRPVYPLGDVSGIDPLPTKSELI